MALSDKRKVFVEEYLKCWNATESARVAGYAFPNVEGSKLLVIPSIADEIKARLADKVMTADEVLVRLADQARGTMNDFVKFDDKGNPTFDLQAASMMGKLGLAKKLKIKSRTYQLPTVSDDEGPIEVNETTTEFELYDAQAALVHIGKHHKLFADKLDVNHSGEVVTKVIEGPKDVR